MEGVSIAPTLGDLVRYYRGIAWKLEQVNDRAIAHHLRLPVRNELVEDWMATGLPMFDGAWEALRDDRVSIAHARTAIANAIIRGGDVDATQADQAMQKLGVPPAVGQTEAHRAHREKLFPKGLPSDTDLIDAIVKLDTERNDKNTDIEILRAFTSEPTEHSPKADKLDSRIRKARLGGRTTLPKRTERTKQ